MTTRIPNRRPPVGAARGTWVIPDDGIIDPIAVEIAANGRRPVRLTRLERRKAAIRILASGGTIYVVAKRLNMSYPAAKVLAASISETDSGVVS
jgi:hypothetical protein